MGVTRTALALALLAGCPPPKQSTTGTTTPDPTGGDPTADPIAAPGDPGTPAAPAAPGSSPAIDALAWWHGVWSPRHSQGYEMWVSAGGALWGINFNGANRPATWEVMVVDDGEGKGPPDGTLRLLAMPGGAKPTEFRSTATTADSVTFENPSHDVPKKIVYRRDEALLKAALDDGREMDWAKKEWKSAPELEDADRAFAADVAARGVDGWLDGFAPEGTMVFGGEHFDRDEIAAQMGPVLAAGKLTWTPVASYLDSTGIGFTVGLGTYTAATPADSWRSSYATLWVKRKGHWRVLFDTGRVINE